MKELWKKLNPRTAMLGGALVVTTTLGTCTFKRAELPEPTPAVESEVEPEAEAPAE